LTHPTCIVPHPFFTIGHSTRAIDDFVGLLRQAEVQLVVDVRAVPRSRTNPQYNGDALSQILIAFQIDYIHIASLGGLRGHARDVADSVNGFWENQSFHNYADYAMTDPFRAGLTELRHLGHARRCAVMCAEAVWWRCHRRIIADHLIAAGDKVFHILGMGRIEPARLTRGARPGTAGALIYPAAGAGPQKRNDRNGRR
jgi:uncharacterized protein (DUF488 family)